MFVIIYIFWVVFPFLSLNKKDFNETYLEACERRERDKCVFKREYRILQSGTRQVTKHRSKQLREIFKAEHGLEDKTNHIVLYLL